MQALEGLHEVAANRAANAPIHHFDDLLINSLRDDLVVDAYFAEFVLDHGELHLVARIIQDAIQERLQKHEAES